MLSGPTWPMLHIGHSPMNSPAMTSMTEGETVYFSEKSLMFDEQPFNLKGRSDPLARNEEKGDGQSGGSLRPNVEARKRETPTRLCEESRCASSGLSRLIYLRKPAPHSTH
jgi:hypothetical protein